MSARVRWENNSGEAELLSVQGLGVVLLSDRAFPPGARPSGVLQSTTELTFQMKVHGSRLEGARYRVHGALINATVAAREAFKSAV